MPVIKAIGQFSLGGFVFLTAQKLTIKLSQYGGNGTPVPERPVRYTPAVISSLSSYSSPDELLSIPKPPNATSTIAMANHFLPSSSSASPLWTMILSLWSLLQVTYHFLAEHCHELITDLSVQLLFFIAMFYLEQHVDQALTAILNHPRSEAPPVNPSNHISKAAIHGLLELADKIQDRISNLEATIATIINEGRHKINNICTELVQAREIITALKRDLAEEQKKEKDLVAANTEIAGLIQALAKKAATAKDLATANDQRANEIAGLNEALAEKEATTKDLAATNAQNANKIAGLNEALAEKEAMTKDLAAVNDQSAQKIASLNEALAKKKEVEDSALSFNPGAKEFTPSPHTPYQQTSFPAAPVPPPPSHFPTMSYQHASPPAAHFPPSPSPYLTTPYQLPPVKKQPLIGEPLRNLEAINESIREQKRRTMIGLPAENEETRQLSAEELDRKMAELSNIRRPSQQLSPAARAFTPRSTQPSPIQPVTSPTRSAPELGPYPGTTDMTGTPPTPSAPELGPSPGTTDMTGTTPSRLPRPPPTGPSHAFPPPQHHPHQGVKPGAPGTPELTWQPPPTPVVPGAPTAPKAMRNNNGKKSDADKCFVQPKPKNNWGNGNYRGRATKAWAPLPAHVREAEARKEEERRGGGAK